MTDSTRMTAANDTAAKDSHSSVNTMWQNVFETKSVVAPQWDSIALECPTSGTILHWISVVGSCSATNQDCKSHHGLLGLTESDTLAESKNALAEAVQSTKSSDHVISFRKALGRTIRTSQLLGKSNLPVLRFSADREPQTFHRKDDAAADRSHACLAPNTLKEIALPAFPHSTYSNGCTLNQRLSQSHWTRPAPGLYQSKSPSGLCLRPLPAAPEDRQLSSPTLVFHCHSLEDALNKLETGNYRNDNDGERLQMAKVGKTGANAGQILLRHSHWQGLDIRLCESRSYQSMFAEAQESLLAASLPELQSKHVLEGTDGTTVDPNTDRVDCWVEFRATLRNPRGFMASREGRVRTTKPPNLPYE